MRLFFALWPDAPVRAALARWSASCRVSCHGRATRTDNLHATLAFLGEVDPARLPALVRIGCELQAVAFDICLDRVAYWPRNRIVYAGASQPPSALSALARALTTRLSTVGHRIDQRPYELHVTLLRDARSSPRAMAIDPLLWRVNHTVLVESVREGGGQVYRPLYRFMLSD
jgi:RNA 2',3'-cyclic 3'-phosphodiesterase